LYEDTEAIKSLILIVFDGAGVTVGAEGVAHVLSSEIAVDEASDA
jgi:hypothetical protein